VQVRDNNNNAIYNFPNLIWWSANGLPLEWDPVENTSAGFNAFLDVPDQITGLATLGVAGYVFRTNGITQFAPSGNAILPFTFDHMWASEHGIGNVFPNSISQYGPQAAFIAQDDVYALSVTSAQKIGGMARDAIFKDLALAAPPLSLSASAVNGAIIPVLQNGYSYLTYQIIITFATGNARLYIYSFEEKYWEVVDLPVSVTGTPRLVFFSPANVI
jgi:hypothetical protein